MFNRCGPSDSRYRMLNSNMEDKASNGINEYGYLDVNVFRYVYKTPIANALLRVSKLTVEGLYSEIGRGNYLTIEYSDNNGNFPTVTLPVLTAENEIYIISVQADEYHTAYVFDVPIYPNISTEYNIYLHHMGIPGSPDYEFILQPRIK